MEKIALILIGSITTAFGAFINHLLTRHRESRVVFNIAAEKFRLAFWPEVEFLDKQFFFDRASIYVATKSHEILSDAVRRHQKAVYIFMDYLSCIDKPRLEKAWKDYYKDSNNPHYFAEEYPCGDEFTQLASEEKALEKIYKILEFAKPK